MGISRSTYYDCPQRQDGHGDRNIFAIIIEFYQTAGGAAAEKMAVNAINYRRLMRDQNYSRSQNPLRLIVGYPSAGHRRTPDSRGTQKPEKACKCIQSFRSRLAIRSSKLAKLESHGADRLHGAQGNRMTQRNFMKTLKVEAVYPAWPHFETLYGKLQQTRLHWRSLSEPAAFEVNTPGRKGQKPRLIIHTAGRTPIGVNML